jgi:hypothetical protein
VPASNSPVIVTMWAASNPSATAGADIAGTAARTAESGAAGTTFVASIAGSISPCGRSGARRASSLNIQKPTTASAMATATSRAVPLVIAHLDRYASCRPE